MNRAERRRLEKQAKKNPAMTIKASELEAIKQNERQKALDTVLPLLLGLPVKVLKEKYNWGTQKRLPDFADALLEAYEAVSYTHLDVYKRQAYKLPEEHYLDQSVCVNIIVDTGDGNYDFVLNDVYPHYNGRYGDIVPEEASVLWLVRQQGFTKRQLNQALRQEQYNGLSLIHI